MVSAEGDGVAGTGALVGLAVIVGVPVVVGILLGFQLGTKLGALDGETDGSCVGVGKLGSPPDGRKTVGCSLGSAERVGLMEIVGRRLGTELAVGR